ncbi:acyl-[acyl-carrier-protein] thioesterase [Desulforegula conservatrix]|uniref:acyl-[acyl-carrier-protein] thioesterase n=1 Tax=Desulforegula conservatrix TaxID=153026 RepID=UPI0004191FB1|nr:acyl-ACP thioesterase domain-containing protein [Desulforegula conservatrix]
MEVIRKHRVEYHEVNTSYKMKLSAILRQFQEAAADHSEKAGFGSEDLTARGVGWVLNRLAMDFYRYPAYGERLEIITWHRGSRGFRSYRDFEVFSGNEKIAAASSIWLFVSLKDKKIMKIPSDVDSGYSSIERKALESDIDFFRPDFMSEPYLSADITVRSTDFDPLGHVNNTVYLDYVETLLAHGDMEDEEIRSVRINYSSEIGKGVGVIRAQLSRDGCGYRFGIMGEKIFAGGMITFRGKI